MNTETIKRTAVAAITAISLAGLVTVSATATAQAGDSKFWRGVAVGTVGTIIIGSAVRNHRNNRVQRVSAWDAHVDWCYDHRPRYRESDNTYRRNGQGRRECISPYYN